MRIAVSADGPGLDARVSYRFGTSPYLIILDPMTMEYEAVPNPGAAGGRGAGMQATALAISRKVHVVITGYCSPLANKYLAGHGIQVLTGVDNTVRGAAEDFLQRAERRDREAEAGPPYTCPLASKVWIAASQSAARQFAGLLPILLGVVFLMGLFTAFVPQRLLSSIFSGHMVTDTLLGACIGSIVAGNPINSYVIGGELLRSGVSLFAVTAFIVAWVSVGLVQLPAEMAALGKRFAFTRTLLSFLAAITTAIAATVVFNAVVGLIH